MFLTKLKGAESRIHNPKIPKAHDKSVDYTSEQSPHITMCYKILPTLFCSETQRIESKLE